MCSLYLFIYKVDYNYYMIFYNCGEFISSFVFQLHHLYSSVIEKLK